MRTLIAQGINLSDKVYHYQNHNFALFRILIPYLNGFDDSGVTDIGTATSLHYLEYMNSVYGSYFKVTCDPNASAGTHILSYPYPAGSSQGIDWGDWTAICGGGGLQLSVDEMGDFLMGRFSRLFSNRGVLLARDHRRVGRPEVREAMPCAVGGWNGFP